MAAEIFCSPLLLSSSLFRCMTLLTVYSFRLSYSCSRKTTERKKLCSFPKSSQDKLHFQFRICGPFARLLSCSAGTHGRACTCASSSPCCAGGAGSLGDVGSLRVYWLSHFLPLSLPASLFLFPLPSAQSRSKGWWWRRF